MISDWLDEMGSDVSNVFVNSDLEDIAMTAWPVIASKARAQERQRIAAYLDKAAASLRGTGLLGDQVSGNAFAQAADYCRDETIWAEANE